MSLLVRGGHSWVVLRGWWPEGRGSARTLVAGGLPLSEEERVKDFRNPYKLSVFSVFSLLLSSLPINLTGHFSRPRLCWCLWCWVISGWCLILGFLHLLDFHCTGSTERVEDNVLVLLPVAGLRVWCGFGITLGKTDRTSVIQVLHELPKTLQIKYFSWDIPQGFCCRSQMQQENLVGSWSGWGCLETKSGWPWEVTQGLLSALLTWADSWGKPLAWESPQSPQGPCRKNKGSAVMS